MEIFTLPEWGLY